MDHRSVLKGWRSSHVHGRTAGFVSRSDPAEDSAPVSTQIGRIQVVCTRRYGAVRSFFGGFSSTAGYVPGNEALVPKDVSGVAPLSWSFLAGFNRFYPVDPNRPEGWSWLSLSASAPGVLDSGFPLLLSANGVSPPPFHFPMPVKMPVSNLDCEASLHP